MKYKMKTTDFQIYDNHCAIERYQKRQSGMRALAGVSTFACFCIMIGQILVGGSVDSFWDCVIYFAIFLGLLIVSWVMDIKYARKIRDYKVKNFNLEVEALDRKKRVAEIKNEFLSDNEVNREITEPERNTVYPLGLYMVLGLIQIILIGFFLIIPAVRHYKEPIGEVMYADDGRSCYCEYRGYDRRFNIYLPDGSENIHKKPLVIMLHGYANTPESFATQTGFEKVACEAGYVVVYPAALSDASGSPGWNSGLDTSEKDDIGYICALAEYIQNAFDCDPQRTFVVGFSNGAFMTHRIAVETDGKFAAIVSVAGMMTDATWMVRKEHADIGVLEIYGTKDDVVPQKANGTDRTSIAPAIEEVMSYWADANGLETYKKTALGDRVTCLKYADEEHRSQVWSVVVDEGRHSWPSQEDIGISANEIIMSFLEEYR